MEGKKMKKGVVKVLLVVLCMIFSMTVLATRFRGDENLLLKNLMLYGEGTAINDYKLGFLWPEYENEDSIGDFDGWLMMYSTAGIDEIWDYLSELTSEEIDALNELEDGRKLYKITTFNYADEYPNTFRSSQKDLLTGKEFASGEYKTYVATMAGGMVKALTMGDGIDIKPYPKNVTLILSENPERFGVSFESYDDDRIIGNLVFFSEKGIYDVTDFLKGFKTAEALKTLSEEKRAKFLSVSKELEHENYFDKDQRTIFGKEFGKNVYYTYVATVGKDGMLGINQAIELIVTAENPKVPTTKIGNGKGTVMAIGGNASVGNPASAELFAVIREAAGGTEAYDPRVAVLSSSRDTLAIAYNHFYFDEPGIGSQLNNFKNVGFDAVHIPLAMDSRGFVMNSSYWADVMRTCDAVFMMGGDQYKHLACLVNEDGSKSEILKAMKDIYNRGGVIAGSSAGMHVMSDPVFGVGNPYESFLYNGTEIFEIKDIPDTGYLDPLNIGNNLMVDGVALMPENVLADTHFDARGRLGRLIIGLRDTGKPIGIGADEGTALAITEENGDLIGTVAGYNGIFILDASQAEYTAKDSGLFGVKGLRLHYLTEGDTFNFTKNLCIVADTKKKAMGEGALYNSEDIFGGYETTRTLVALANATEEVAKGKVAKPTDFGAETPEFVVLFKKTGETECYTSDIPYYMADKEWGEENLADDNKISIINLIVDVEGQLPEVDFEITGIELKAGSDYTQYILFTKAIDPESVNQKTVVLTGNEFYYPDDPIVRKHHDDQIIIEFYNKRSEGTTLEINGVMDRDGNTLQGLLFEFDGNNWILK